MRHVNVLTNTDERHKHEIDLSNAVYAASVKIFETLEYAGHIRGNGHHMAQALSAQAVSLLKERWWEDV